MRTEMPTATCAGDGTGIARIPAASRSERMKRAIRMMFTFLACAGRCCERDHLPVGVACHIEPAARAKVASLRCKGL